MSGPLIDEQERATEDVARVRVANGPLLGPVLRRVVSIVLARADWPLDRLDDALLICDALCAHGPAYAKDGRLTFSVQADEQQAVLRILELSAADAAELLGDAKLPVVGNVLESVAERVSVESADGAGSQLVLVLRAS